MSKIISFIIPSYNVEEYLTKALDSFLVPELETQIEVIVVDDGSYDQTAVIAQSYLERFPNILKTTLNVNGLNTLSRRQRLSGWIRKENLVHII